MSSDHLRNISRSSGSTPSMSPMTAIGSGAAMSQTKSHSPRSHTASIRVSHSAPIAGLPVLHALAGEARVDELAPQQMCGIVHRDHHRRRVLVGPDSARVGEQLGLALGVDHRLVRRALRPGRCGRGTPARAPASTCRSTASRRRRRRRRSGRHPAWSAAAMTSISTMNPSRRRKSSRTLRSGAGHQRAFRQAQ